MQALKPKLKILYMSGYTSSMSAIESGAIMTGTSLFLQKPFKPKKLAEAVRTCLEETTFTGTSPSPTAASPAGRVRLFA
jgi:DNA-binding NtrC family response regulator